MKTSFGDSRHLKCSEEALEKDQSGTTDRHSWGASLSARANFTLITASLVGVGGDGGKRAKGEREEVGWKRERERERERERGRERERESVYLISDAWLWGHETRGRPQALEK